MLCTCGRFVHSCLQGCIPVSQHEWQWFHDPFPWSIREAIEEPEHAATIAGFADRCVAIAGLRPFALIDSASAFQATSPSSKTLLLHYALIGSASTFCAHRLSSSFVRAVFIAGCLFFYFGFRHTPIAFSAGRATGEGCAKEPYAKEELH